MEDLSKLPVIKLKALCRARNLTVSGNKDVLVQRLLGNRTQTTLHILNKSLMPKVVRPQAVVGGVSDEALCPVPGVAGVVYEPTTGLCMTTNPYIDKSVFAHKFIVVGVYRDGQMLPLDRVTVDMCKERRVPYDWTMVV